MTSPKITVITPTARYGGVDIWKTSLQRQTFQDFEALFIDELYVKRFQEVSKYVMEDFRFVHLSPPPKREGRWWNLDRSVNYGISLARGELIVFLQDYIWLPNYTLKKFWDRYVEMGEVIISGVGHKAQHPEWAINLYGLITVFEDQNQDYISIPPQRVWFRDPRIQGRGFHLCNPIEWEADCSAAPMSVCEAIGGFDEDFDRGWGYDNVNFAERAQIAGYQVWLDETNEHVGYSHELLFHEEQRKNSAPNNTKMWEAKVEALQRGQASPKVSWLEIAKQESNQWTSDV